MSMIIKEYIRAMPFILAKPNIESNVYNNCILIQKCVNMLVENNAFSELELDVLVAVFKGFSFVEIGRMLGIQYRTASAVFTKVTDRIAFVLGGEFSDSALFDAMYSHSLDEYIKAEED